MRRKAARMTKQRPKAKPLRFYYQALLWENPTLAKIKAVRWIKYLFGPPDFKVVTIQDGNVDQLSCKVSRGLKKTAPDMVCWVNKDSTNRLIQFMNAQWPFDPALNTDNEKIHVPAKSASAWYRVSPSSGAPGLIVTYEYGVDVAPGPPGPGIITED